MCSVKCPAAGCALGQRGWRRMPHELLCTRTWGVLLPARKPARCCCTWGGVCGGSASARPGRARTHSTRATVQNAHTRPTHACACCTRCCPWTTSPTAPTCWASCRWASLTSSCACRRPAWATKRCARASVRARACPCVRVRVCAWACAHVFGRRVGGCTRAHGRAGGWVAPRPCCHAGMQLRTGGQPAWGLRIERAWLAWGGPAGPASRRAGCMRWCLCWFRLWARATHVAPAPQAVKSGKGGKDAQQEGGGLQLQVRQGGCLMQHHSCQKGARVRREALEGRARQQAPSSARGCRACTRGGEARTPGLVHRATRQDTVASMRIPVLPCSSVNQAWRVYACVCACVQMRQAPRAACATVHCPPPPPPPRCPPRPRPLGCGCRPHCRDCLCAHTLPPPPTLSTPSNTPGTRTRGACGLAWTTRQPRQRRGGGRSSRR